ncbi:MAG: hypothetical protein QOH42_849 [Blastocatellia bacterium]|jgi:hypothetical protein|nr:hypothetical protein [Blastocatellia bacterium]
MSGNEYSVEIAGGNLAGQNHVCAFFNTSDEEHRVLGSFYKDGFDRGEKATHIVDSENRDIMRTHPLVIIGGLLRENPFFVPPDQFLNEMRERRSARKTAS